MTLGFSVKTYHLQNGRVATNDEGQAAKTLDAVSDSYRQLFVKVFGTALESEMIDVRVDRQKKTKKYCKCTGQLRQSGCNIYQDVVSVRRLPRIQQGCQGQTHRGLKNEIKDTN